MTGDRSSNSTAVRLRRVRATERSTWSGRCVCPIGWGTPVHRLEGAAAAVWSVLATCDRRQDLARALGVADDDPYLQRAIDLLADAGLIEIGEGP